jgi:hypothetical protein
MKLSREFIEGLSETLFKNDDKETHLLDTKNEEKVMKKEL